MSLPSTPYFLCFHYFGPIAAHSHFSTSYTAHGLLFPLFPGSFKPIYLFKTHLFISWACNPLFMSLGLNGFSIHLPTPFCPCCWASSSHLGFQNGPQHSQIQNQRFTNAKYLMRIAHKPKRVTKQFQKLQRTRRERITKLQN